MRSLQGPEVKRLGLNYASARFWAPRVGPHWGASGLSVCGFTFLTVYFPCIITETTVSIFKFINVPTMVKIFTTLFQGLVDTTVLTCK